MKKIQWEYIKYPEKKQYKTREEYVKRYGRSETGIIDSCLNEGYSKKLMRSIVLIIYSIEHRSGTHTLLHKLFYTKYYRDDVEYTKYYREELLGHLIGEPSGIIWRTVHLKKIAEAEYQKDLKEFCV